MATIITIANQKGGCAKTTTVLNLAYSLSKMGKKVLAVDFDSQANLTTGFGVDNPKELDITIAELMDMEIEDEELPDKETFILHHEGVDFIPSSISLSVIDMKLQQSTIFSEKTLSNVLEPLADEYDYILIDTCPSLGNLTINALTAADDVIITVNPQFWGMMGVDDLLRTIAKIKKKINPRLSIRGILLTMCNVRTKLYKMIIQDVEEAFKDKLHIFGTHIPMTIKLGESAYYGLSIEEYASNSIAGIAYMNFARELERMYEGDGV
ncbi:MAG: AAA family ATPase [Clostridium sp.]|nr:AAA family ATPase [Clostridium sp.]